MQPLSFKEKNRQITMKKVHTGQIIAAIMAGGMTMATGIAHAEVVGNTSTDFTVGIDVHDADACSITVTPPATRAFSFGWNGEGAGEPGFGENRISIVKLGEAPVISVVASGGDSCSVNGVKLITRGGEGAMAVPGLKGQPTMVKSFGTKKGIWPARPLLSKITLYTTADKSTVASDKVTVKTATGGSFTQSDKVAFAADWWGGPGRRDEFGMSNVAIPAPQWFSERAQPALLGADAAEGTLTWLTDKANIIYKAADFGINVMVGTDPLGNDGKPSLDVTTAGDKISIPFTVTVSQS
ncbi:hypothetical protein R0K18_15170 [Pantoea sp. SIMBA_133]